MEMKMNNKFTLKFFHPSNNERLNDLIITTMNQDAENEALLPMKSRRNKKIFAFNTIQGTLEFYGTLSQSANEKDIVFWMVNAQGRIVYVPSKLWRDMYFEIFSFNVDEAK